MLRSDDIGVPQISAKDLCAIDARTIEISRRLFSSVQAGEPTVFRKQWWDERIMSWVMHDQDLKVQLFRFIDVLPMLTSDRAVAQHLADYLADVDLPVPMRSGLNLAAKYSWGNKALAQAARVGATDHARRFIAGSNVGEVLDAAAQQRKLRRAFTLDILGEAVISESEAEGFFDAYVKLLTQVSPQVNAWKDDPLVDQAESGPIPRMNLSIKLSALDSQFDAVDHVGTLRRVGKRLRQLLRIAKEQRAFINVDMESYATKDLTLDIFKSVLSEDEFRSVTDVGIVIQCYLRDAARDIRQLRDWAATRSAPVWVRLVKGAYWDYETIKAKANGWPIPVFQQKRLSDANFQQITRFLLTNAEHLKPAFGSHNVRSIAHVMAVAEHLHLNRNGLEFQMLYGMADAEKAALVDMGYRMRVYMPYGELIPGMAYLVRRLLENTSNDSFLRASSLEDSVVETLLKDPESEPDAEPVRDNLPMKPRSTVGQIWYEGFTNQPPVNFAVASNREQMQSAIEQVQSQLGSHAPLSIGGKDMGPRDVMRSINPGRHRQLVGTVPVTSSEHADLAVEAAKDALESWSATPVKRRCDYLRGAAQLMRDRLFELAAWEVFECGKGWSEATGDIDEAIDFCEYYALGAEAMQRVDGVHVAGEQNTFSYLPRGVTAVIAPWNFPLAILTGMTVAALATGNTVVMKPAEQSPIIASKLMEIFQSVRLPEGVLNFLPGKGRVVGARLVDHPDVSMIAFTGSRAVGLHINAQSAKTSLTGYQVKKVIAEMGGKNAIIVDADADLDEAVTGVVKSAFGFQGQKCSACSRVIVLEEVHDTFVSRLVEATRSLRVGQASDPSSSVGPVIDAEAYKKTLEYIALGRDEGNEVLSVDVGELANEGYFVGPHIFTEISPTARLAQEEVFGPVLAVIRAASLAQAIDIANGTEYALTGGVFSRSPANLQQVQDKLIVGNLYLNRAITGALVGRQPFGGFRMSGIGSKAGGPDYLLQFVVPRTVTTNTMRRGFAPS